MSHLRAGLLMAIALLAAPASGQVVYTEISVAGDAPANGIFDPSMEFDADGSTGWLAYSAVFGDVSPWGPHVETHLARSEDGGASWEFQRVLNPSTPGTLELVDGSSIDGVWNAEVASLVHDPGDPGREWKVFFHRIFRRAEDGFTGEQNEPAYSWIALRTAPDPAGPWSDEVALLAAGPLPPPPYAGVQVALNSLDPSLADLLVYSEPGAFARDGVLMLSLTGLDADGPDRIVLFASDDHGASWRYVSTPLVNADALPLGWSWFDGSSIAAEDGRVFLMVTPGTPTLVHDGTLIFEFADLAAGELIRSGGAPRVHKVVPLQAAVASERGAGQSTFHEHATTGGLLMPQIVLPDFPRFFQIFATGERLVDAAPLPASSPAWLGVAVAGLSLAARSRAARGRRPAAPRGRSRS